MLTMGIDILENKANMLYNLLMERITQEDLIIDIVDSYSEVGGGSLPLERIPTKCISLRFEVSSITEFEKHLRKLDVPIITRVYKDTIYIDLRTVKEEEFYLVVDGISCALKELGGVH